MDLRGARQQRLVSQQLGEDAAHSPAAQRMCKEESVVAGEPPPSPRVLAVLAPVNPPGTAQPASAPPVLCPHPYHMSMLVVCVVVPSSSSGARYLRREGAGLQEAPAAPCRTRPVPP